MVEREAMAKMKQHGPVELSTTDKQHKPTTNSQQPQLYRRPYYTAEEKIQSELKEMQLREEELRWDKRRSVEDAS